MGLKPHFYLFITWMILARKLSELQSYCEMETFVYHVQLFATPWTAAHQASLSFTISWSLLKLTSVEPVMLSNYLILCCPLLLFLSISFPASESFPMSRLFVPSGQNIGALASVLPMHIQDWFPLGLTALIFLLFKELSRVFSNTSLKASILRCSAFFTVQLSHPYITTGKTIALTIQTFK